MRRLLAGIFLIFSLLTLPLKAETTGFVESIGFGWMFRPNCHIPMLVNVTPDKSGTYQIRVYQEDMDRDLEIFTQTVSLTGSADGAAAAAQQKFWIYFIPQPTEGGLSNLTLRELQSQLRVFLCDEKGKQIAQLPVTQTIQNVDGAQAGPFSIPRGNKVILAVTDSATNQPIWHDYQQSIGLIEDIIFCPVRSFELPEDVRGYEMIDGIVWLDANPPDPSKASDEKRYQALRQYVRGGGHLVICQPPQRDATANFDDILPVKVTAIAPKGDLSPLSDIARVVMDRKLERDKNFVSTPPTAVGTPLDEEDPGGRGPRENDWDRANLQKPFAFARAELKSDSIAPIMIDWNKDGKDMTPWLARHGVGAGCVTWVAQDLTDPAIVSRAKSGWPVVWDRVLDYNNPELLILDSHTLDQEKAPYAANATVDIGHSLLSGMELASKSRALVSIAVVFFIGYWVIAGPGVYFYLLTKSRAQLSWFLFGLAALAATFFTVLVVKLVVRGAPEISHITLVRAAANEPAISLSRFGLYIPRDGPQEIKLPDIAPKEVSYITAYPEHPSHAAGDVEFPAAEHYDIPIRDANSDEPCAIVVPYRSTLKKFETRRVGNVSGLVQGTAKIHDKDTPMTLDGTVTNGTGQKLHNIYFIFHDPRIDDDVIFFLPTWEKGMSIDLYNDFAGRNNAKAVGFSSDGPAFAKPEDGLKLVSRLGKFDVGWSRYWYNGYRVSGIGAPTHDDLNDPVPTSFPMMSIFGRLPPMKNSKRDSQDRSDILRRGGRYLDVSAAISAGKLLVLAEGDGEQQELPFPLEVEGDKVPGKGRIFYQFVLALDHPAGTETAATQKAVDTSPAPAALPEPEFDPSSYVGGPLTPEQQAKLRKWRMDNPNWRYRPRQANPPKPPAAPAAPTPPPQPQSSSFMKPLKFHQDQHQHDTDEDALACATCTREAATWPL